jgi:hypothetical protein
MFTPSSLLSVSTNLRSLFSSLSLYLGALALPNAFQFDSLGTEKTHVAIFEASHWRCAVNVLDPSMAFVSLTTPFIGKLSPQEHAKFEAALRADFKVREREFAWATEHSGEVCGLLDCTSHLLLLLTNSVCRGCVSVTIFFLLAQRKKLPRSATKRVLGGASSGVDTLPDFLQFTNFGVYRSSDGGVVCLLLQSHTYARTCNPTSIFPIHARLGVLIRKSEASHALIFSVHFFFIPSSVCLGCLL